jgi:DNA-binding MarR family transcriptional regulator
MSADPTTLPTPGSADTAAGRPPFPPALMGRVGFILGMVKGGGEAICMRALAPLQLPVKQYGLLTVLATEGPLSQQELAEWVRTDRTTMVAQIDSMEERGWVRRERNPGDRRAYLLQLTSSGKRIQARAAQIMDRAEDDWLGSLNERERRQLLSLLSKVAVDVGRPMSDHR